MRDIEGFTPGQHHYFMRNTQMSSAKYGVCEVCKKDVSETWHQVEERFFEHKPSSSLRPKGWTHHMCNSLFGHYDCLVSRRRGPYLRTYIDPEDQREYHLHDVPSATGQQQSAAAPANA